LSCSNPIRRFKDIIDNVDAGAEHLRVTLARPCWIQRQLLAALEYPL
jgi:hypothetical protein